MKNYAALDVSMEQTAICVVNEDGRKVVEGKVLTCPDAIATWLGEKAPGLVKVGMETGPLAVWLWNELVARRLPIVCLDARHASAALAMMSNKTDRHDAVGWRKSSGRVGIGRFASRAMVPTWCGRFYRRGTSLSTYAPRSRTKSAGS